MEEGEQRMKEVAETLKQLVEGAKEDIKRTGSIVKGMLSYDRGYIDGCKRAIREIQKYEALNND